MLVGTMVVLGLFLGFVGAGGSGFIVALLTVIFGYSIHIASGTALAAMVFSSLSGAYSHFRSRQVALAPGLGIGSAGAVGALITSHVAAHLPAHELKVLTASVLFLSALVMAARLVLLSPEKRRLRPRDFRFWTKALILGLFVGSISGMFGIGAAPFIQLGLLWILGIPLIKVPGTTMLVIVPTAIAGAIGYYHAGYLDFPLLAEVALGMVLGTYVGAKFTRRVPQNVLKSAMVLVPVVGASIMLW